MKNVMIKIAIVMTAVYIRLLDALVAIFFKDHVSKTMHLVCDALESKTRYISYQITPKDTTEIPLPDNFGKPHSFAIILQGPICTKDDITIKSIRFYKKVYPYAKIIVSTWNDEPEELCSRLSELGAIIVRSEKPENSGSLNVNYQLVNSLAGVKKAQELHCEFAIKTRTDQRVCKPYIFDVMMSAIKLFPGGKGQKGRIVVLGVNGGGMFSPYYPYDFLYLGYTQDLFSLFSAPLDERKNDKNARKTGVSLTRRQRSVQMIAPEIYILKHYCTDVLGLSCEDTVEGYWNVVKNYLICFGMNDVRLMWTKYEFLHDLNFFSSAYSGKDSQEHLSTMSFDFYNWLNLYVGNFEYDKNYEKYSDV